MLFIGEVGLSGEVRLANQIAKRIKEAEKFGFEKIVIGKTATQARLVSNSKIKIIQVDYLNQAIEMLGK
jgi:DNA repair protein RadA/Sms